MELFAIWLACGVFSAIIAAAKGRSFFGWLILGCIFGIFALLAVGFMPSKRYDQTDDDEPVLPGRRRTLKRCPECAEDVMAEAHVCKHCGHRFA